MPQRWSQVVFFNLYVTDISDTTRKKKKILQTHDMPKKILISEVETVFNKIQYQIMVKKKSLEKVETFGYLGQMKLSCCQLLLVLLNVGLYVNVGQQD